MSTFSHLKEDGKANMVDVSNKTTTQRVAVAQAIVLLPDNVELAIEQGDTRGAKAPISHTTFSVGISG